MKLKRIWKLLMSGLKKMKSKIIDCITFFSENFIFDLRYNVIKDYVDYFVICESKFDHKGNPKKLNFSFKNTYDQKKIKYLILDEKIQNHANPWKNQAVQRDFILRNLDFAHSEDYIFFSDPDEIPNPKILKNFSLKKKYGIFLQKFFNYKFNLFNPHETPWEGSRVCKKKNLKSINFMRQKVLSKNLMYSFLRFDKEKNIELFNNAGWHFNNIMSPEQISLKLKTFAHTNYAREEFSSSKTIKEKIEKKIDLFNRGHNYTVVDLNNEFPEYLLQNKIFYKEFIL